MDSTKTVKEKYISIKFLCPIRKDTGGGIIK